MGKTKGKNGSLYYIVTAEDQHAVQIVFKYSNVEHNIPKPLPKVYLWKKSRSPRYKFPALEGESG